MCHQRTSVIFLFIAWLLVVAIVCDNTTTTLSRCEEWLYLDIATLHTVIATLHTSLCNHLATSYKLIITPLVGMLRFIDSPPSGAYLLGV